MEQVIRRSAAAQSDAMPTGLCEVMAGAESSAFSNRLPELRKDL